MKKLKRYALILTALLSVTFFSCDDNDSTPKGEFEHGVFVVNEGNFGTGNGTVSFIASDATVTQDLFGSVNNGLALGDVVQSMTVDNDLAYIVVNNSNKMEVVDANTFVKKTTVSGLALPRYFTTLDGKGYVTEWVSFTDPGRVSIVDLTTFAVTESITTDFGAENITAFQGKLYVSNNFTNTVSVIDPTSKKVIKTIEVASAPGDFLVDKNDKLWVICGGNFDGNDGALVQLDPSKSTDAGANSILKTIELNMNVSRAAINEAEDKIFFYNGTSAYSVNITDTNGPTSPLLTEASATKFYSIGIDPENDILYLGDSKGFTVNGVVYRYTLSGTVVDNVAAGRGPNNFVFK